MNLIKFFGDKNIESFVAEGPVYRPCTSCKIMKHFTEYVNAKWGWMAPDGFKKHSQCKICKRTNQSLVNNLRLTVNVELMHIANEKHPHHELWVKTEREVRNEHPEWRKPLLSAPLTREAYLRVYKELGMEIPDLEKVLHKKHGRGSTGEDSCLDYLNIPRIERVTRQVKIGRYYVDGLVGNNVYEFFGDFYHGNPKEYSSEKLIRGGTVGEKWEKDKKRAEIIKSKGYNFKVIWESDWTDFQQGRTNKLKIKEGDEIWI